MVDRIQAKAWTFRGFNSDSPEGAIAASREFNRRHADGALDPIVGKRVDNIEYYDDALYIYFEGESKLRVQIEGDGVIHCDIQGIHGNIIDASRKSKGDAIIEINGIESIWNRDSIIDRMKFTILRKVFFSKDGIYIYLSDNASIRVSSMVNLKSMRPFLFWWPAG